MQEEKPDVFKWQIAILSEILSSVKWRSHGRLKNKWEAEIQVAIKDKKVLREVISHALSVLDTLFLKADERIARAGFWNTASRNRQNGIVIVPQGQGVKTAGS